MERSRASHWTGLLACLLMNLATVRADPLSLYGISFGPYVEGKEPGDGITEGEIDRLLRIVWDSGFSQRIRTYGADDGLEVIPRKAHEIGFSEVAMGTWIAGIDRDHPLSNPQINELITQARAGRVHRAVIGNEEILAGRSCPQQMADLIRTVQEEIAVPVTTPEPFGVWFDGDQTGASVKPEMEGLVRQVDEVWVNIYPFHRGTPIDQALAQLDALYSSAADAVHVVAPGKPVVVAETGWPSAGGDASTPVTSPENAETYLLGAAEWSNAEGVPMYYFEAFDEAWKAPPEYEAHWGIWRGDGELKLPEPAALLLLASGGLAASSRRPSRARSKRTG